MSGKREPVAYIGAEDYRIVKHTHDIELATRLMRIAIIEENGCQRWETGWPHDSLADCTEECEAAVKVGQPELRYVRQVNALPSSFAASEGWRYSFHEHDQPSRGAWPAVVFR